MAETNTDATVIDAESTEVTASSSSGGSNLPLILSALALAVGLVAIFLALRGGSGLGSDETAKLASVDGLEMRLKSLETEGGSRVDLSGIQAEISSVKSDLAALEGDLAATIEAVNAELSKVQAVDATSGEASGVASGALAQVNEQLSGLSSTVEGSLAQIGDLTSRIGAAEGLLQNLPAQVDEQVAAAMGAIDEVRTANADRFDSVQSAIDEGMSAFAALSNQTESAISDTRSEVSARFDEVTTGFSDQLATLSASMDAAKASTDEQMASLSESFSGLTDEFTALKEVSVETSTKVLAVNQLRDALASSAPVRPHMTSLKALNPTEEPLLAVMETVEGIADLRVPTQQMLADTIRDISPKLVSETRINTAEGTGGKVLARLNALVSVERIEDIASIPGIEGNMARAAARIEEGDFDAALTELTDETVVMDLTADTQARYDALVADLGNRAIYEAQRRVLGDWVTTTLNSARATAAN